MLPPARDFKRIVPIKVGPSNLPVAKGVFFETACVSRNRLVSSPRVRFYPYVFTR
jgi:hypothetical protein